MRIIDAQIHDVGPYWDWLGESDDLQHKIMGEVMIAYLDALGVQSVVLFPGGHDPHADWLSKELPDRFTYVPHVSPDDGDIEAVVRDAKANRGIAGLRAVIGWPLDGGEVKRLEAGDWDPVFAACERHRVPLFLFITGWLPLAAGIAERFPGLSLIIDHLGLRQPPLDQPDDPPFANLHQLLDLARFPNLTVKLCGLPSLSQERFPFKDAAPALRAITDAFGADRLMWASDTTRFAGRIGIGRFQNPRTLDDYPGKHSYAESLLFIRESGVLTPDEKENILGGTAARVLNWS
jgi:predicted TIM-barrel fold metal-dependent hydrolase